MSEQISLSDAAKLAALNPNVRATYDCAIKGYQTAVNVAFGDPISGAALAVGPTGALITAGFLLVEETAHILNISDEHE